MSRTPGVPSPKPELAGAGVPPTASEEQLAGRFAERVKLFAARHLNDAAAADDVAQETLRRVVEAIRSNKIINQQALPGFVFQTARNICLHWVRSTAREQSAFARLEREPGEPRACDALAALVTSERAQAVKAAIGRLASEDRQLLRMFFYEELETDLIATRLGITAMAVRVRKHRALRRLGVELGDSL